MGNSPTGHLLVKRSDDPWMILFRSVSKSGFRSSGVGAGKGSEVGKAGMDPQATNSRIIKITNRCKQAP